jgi:hypothetical protein
MKKSTKIIITIACILFGIVIGGAISHCAHNENKVHYGDDNYIFVMCVIGSGRSEEEYFGTIAKKDYQKWLNGDNGTIFVYHSHEENRGWNLSVGAITSIVNYGTSPKWLPLNF